MPGKFIVVEGLDRSGKSTQCSLLARKSRKTHENVVELKFPDRTTRIGQLLNDYSTDPDFYLNDQAVHLLFSANRWEVSTKMRQLLNEGAILVVDRYIYSGVAFSSAKGLDLDWCAAPDVGLPLPDLVIFSDSSEKTAALRGGYGNERYENKEMQSKVREQFRKLERPNWAWIHADDSIDRVSVNINLAVSKLFE